MAQEKENLSKNAEIGVSTAEKLEIYQKTWRNRRHENEKKIFRKGFEILLQAKN